MDITPTKPLGRNIIDAYSDSGFTICEKEFSGSILLLPTQTLNISFSEKDIFEEEKLATLLSPHASEKIEVLLIGTGKKHVALQPHLRQKIKEKLPHTSIDEMTTDAACRTFNILTLEDRHVAAILIV